MPCFFNHPTRIVCPTIITECRNEVINPVITNDFGYFYNTAVGEIDSGEIIPVMMVLGRGPNITPSITTTGAVTLQPGTYQISYSAEGTVPASGSISVGLRINGVGQPGTAITETTTAGDVVSMSRTIMINIGTISTLELINTGVETTTYTFGNLAITRL